MSRTSAVMERRTEIIEAAIRVLSRDGITETTTRKIALRYYFGSKDDLLFAVLQEMMSRTREIVQAGTPIGCGLHEAISESLKTYWAYVEASPELEVMQYELTLYALRHSNSAWLAQQQYDGYATVVTTMLQDGFEAVGKTCAIPLAELARFIIGGLDGLLLQFISDRDTNRARRHLDHLIKAVITLAEGADV